MSVNTIKQLIFKRIVLSDALQMMSHILENRRIIHVFVLCDVVKIITLWAWFTINRSDTHWTVVQSVRIGSSSR